MATWYCGISHNLKKFDDLDSFEVHMKNLDEHPKPPTDLQLAALSRRKQQILLREEYTCPLCECIPDTIKPVIPGSDAEEVGRLLAKHIAEHLKPLAFISLPELETTPSVQGGRSEADSKSARRLRNEGSKASFPSGFDSDIEKMSLPFDDLRPDQRDLSEDEEFNDKLSPDIDKFYVIELTKDDHWELFWRNWPQPEYDPLKDPRLRALILHTEQMSSRYVFIVVMGSHPPPKDVWDYNFRS
jgi:hypothetical protein